MSACAVCNADDIEDIEEVGHLALAGGISWSEASRRTGRTLQSLKNHMLRHVVAVAESEKESFSAKVEDDLDVEIEKSAAELLQQARLAPPELKAFYLAAVKNLRELKNTKPSQQHLLAALKGIHEVTGMSLQNQMMMRFMQVGFEPAPKQVESTHTPIRELPSGS